MKRATVAAFCLVSASLLSYMAPAAAARVESFRPQGEVRDAARVVVVFDTPMVKLGEANASAPFDVQCSHPGRSRWADQRTWNYSFASPLPAGGSCDFTLKADVRALNGEGLDGQRRFALRGPGPWLRQVLPRAGARVEEDQAFLLVPALPVPADSIDKNLWCEAEGVAERIPVKRLADRDRDAIVATIRAGSGFGQAIAVQCAQRLPGGAKLRLVWGAGMASADGVATRRDQSFEYAVRAPFTVSFSCERERADAPCSPLSSLRLDFSEQVPRSLAAGLRLKTAGGDRLPQREGVEEGDPHVAGVRFAPPFAPEATLRIELPKDFADASGRAAQNAGAFPLVVRTGRYPPLAKFPGRFGIVELNEGGVLPVSLRQVEATLPGRREHLPGVAAGERKLSDLHLNDDVAVIEALRALELFERQGRPAGAGRAAAGEGGGEGEDAADPPPDPWYPREVSFLAGRPAASPMQLPKPGGAEAFEVVGIPLAKPGLHIVELESRLLGAALLATPKPMYVRSAVLVTDLAVHFKKGRDNALIWVTTLATGQAVAGADLRVSDCRGKPLWIGRSDAAGLARIDQALPDGRGCDGGPAGLFISARRGEDFSFTLAEWQRGIEPWRFNLDAWSGGDGALTLHTVFDRVLLRAGETVSMKHIARRPDAGGFALPAAAALPDKLRIEFAGGEMLASLPLAWDAKGVATTQWQIPETAKLGSYQVVFEGGESGYWGGSGSRGFRVAEFRLPVFSGSVSSPRPRLVAPSEVPLDLQLAWLNGGGAGGQTVQVSAVLRALAVEFPRYREFRFDLPEEIRQERGLSGGANDQLVADKQRVTLDRNGAGKTTVRLPGKLAEARELRAEMSFADPNGEIQTIGGRLPLWPAAVVAGVRVRDWTSVKRSGRAEVVVLDIDGRPVADAEVRVSARRRIDFAHRKRVVGGFYSYENRHELRDLGEICQGRSDARGMLSCGLRVTEPGSVYLIAAARDAEGRVAEAGTSFWVSGDGDALFEPDDQDRIDVIPEKRAYKAGETARLQVRTPFREATALVSIEREGIIDSFVRPLRRADPVVEIPVKAEWGPNVFVSVMLVRGRLTPLSWRSFFDWGWKSPLEWFKEWWYEPKPTAMIDLAKPAFKLGIGEIEVGGEAFALQVELQPDRASYQTRDRAKVALKVTTPDGRPAPAGTEVAVAAVDQALLELAPNDSWQLFEAMLQRRGYQVETSTGQTQVIGKRHFGKKAVAAGGGGGRQSTRELFDTLLLWQPRVSLDADGRASVEVPLNDSLSEFRVAGIASSAARFGTGSTSLHVRQDLQAVSGLPPLVRELDRYRAAVTLRNASGRAMQVVASARAGPQQLAPQTLTLAAGAAAEAAWEVSAPEGVERLDWEFAATEQGGGARDRLKIVQKIEARVPLAVAQATIGRVDGAWNVDVAAPAGALPGRGGIVVGLQARLSGRPEGLRRFFETYPFVCLEQRASKAVGLRDAALWEQIVARLPTYLDADGFARYFPGDGPGSDVLTAYLLSIAHEAGWALPEALATRLENALVGFVEGRVRRTPWAPRDDLVDRKLAAIDALARRGKAKAIWLTSLEIRPEALANPALIDWLSILRRLPEAGDRAARLNAATAEVRRRLSYAGGRLVFAGEAEQSAWWRMLSGDTDAFRLVHLIADDPAWVDEAPRLLAGALQRQRRGAWWTTTANVWAGLALDKFGRVFDQVPVRGTTRATLGDAPPASVAWAGGKEDGRLSLPWPVAAGVMKLTHDGAGKPWAFVQVLAAVPATESVSNGLRVTRTVTPVEAKRPGAHSRGDLWRVRLEVEASQPLNWIVVSDPIPAGATILGDGGGRDTALATGGERAAGGAWPAFVERAFAGYRAYYEFVPKGRFSTEYTLRLNNAGDFSLPPTRVEAMYAPEIFAELPNAKVVVAGQ